MPLQRRSDITYILGLIFLIAGIIYFFASNWQGFTPIEKTSLAIGLVLLGYVAALFYRNHHLFSYLSRWWLIFSAIAFGVSVALIGQMYNSHADSYVLFLVWLIPTFALALITRYQPMYWMSFILFELALWLKIYPTGFWIQYTIWEELLIYLALIILHSILYIFLNKCSLQKLSFLAVIIIQWTIVSRLIKHSILSVMKNFDGAMLLYFTFHVLYVAFMVYFLRKQFTIKHKHPFIFAVDLLAFGAYIIFNSFEIYVELFGDYFFISSSLLLILLFVFSTYGVKKLKESEKSNQKWTRYSYQFFTMVLSFLGTIIAIATLVSFFTLLFGWEDSSVWLTLGIGAALIVGAGTIHKNSFIVPKTTLQITGAAFLFIFAFWRSELWAYALISALFIGITAFYNKKYEGIIFYLAANGAILSFFMMVVAEYSFSYIVAKIFIFVLFTMNSGIYLISKSQPIGKMSYALSLAFLFYLTYDFDEQSLALSILFNLMAIMYLCFHLYRPVTPSRSMNWLTWGAFIAYITWKYYEYIWSLLHKSIGFLLLSALFFAIFYLWGKKSSLPSNKIAWHWKGILVLAIIQFAFIGGTAYQKESQLQQGELVALSLQPVDPRSMLQGDYVQLGYSIANDYREQVKNDYKGRVTIQLKPTTKTVTYQGEKIPVYEAKNFSHTKTKPKESLFMNGKGYYGTLTMGIEHFFIEENTGEKWEGKKFALVKIAKNGDAILVTLVD
ncbi:putative membrane-anchored protein/putative membrane protein [Oikeobacillus pervagus]|uniref:Membrane-anchored protein/putative membrane protein n=1 Tax=Oikeobacillus pervagus TaxID=1325931 RepID=A0AAJ1T4T3_9BACI|nr:GDYXXLXY domain-containing protein [Oikeobacillus pervagus]MDQ0215874.1 putative membrane-anchored protein/putative membrane protein [Oikeobacillus pervagus]